MGLQLKEGISNRDTNEAKKTNPVNPWDLPGENGTMEAKPFTVTSKVQQQVSQDRDGGVVNTIIKVVAALVIAAVIILIGKQVASKLLPEGEDITDCIGKSETEIASTLGVQFTDNTTWAQNMIQFSGSDLTIHGNDDLGVVYINGNPIGLHINSKKYTMYGIQVGQAEKDVYEDTTYLYDNVLHILDNGGKEGTTTYYYYNKSRNDCIAIVINDTTNRIVAYTYYNNYSLIMKNADSF